MLLYILEDPRACCNILSLRRSRGLSTGHLFGCLALSSGLVQGSMVWRRNAMDIKVMGDILGK